MKHIVDKPMYKLALICIVPWVIFLIFCITITPLFTTVLLKSCLVFIIIVALIIGIPGISYGHLMWEVDQHQLRYTC